MKSLINLGLLCALFSEVAALTCYECFTSDASGTCTSTNICSSGSCGSMTVATYVAGIKSLAANGKGCFPLDQCRTSGSLNFGIAKTTVNTKCCDTDRCNSQRTPELNTNNTPNGKKCFTCDGDDCTKQLSCVGDEDRCIKAITAVGEQKIIIKGCGSTSLCTGHLASQAMAGTGLNCCEGNLCNSAKSVGQSVLLLLGSLVSVLFFH